MKPIVCFRLPCTDEERPEAEALRKQGYEAAMILLTTEEFQQLKKLFDQPPKHCGESAGQERRRAAALRYPVRSGEWKAR